VRFGTATKSKLPELVAAIIEEFLDAPLPEARKLP
jgi:hypothetical protein